MFFDITFGQVALIVGTGALVFGTSSGSDVLLVGQLLARKCLSDRWFGLYIFLLAAGSPERRGHAFMRRPQGLAAVCPHGGARDGACRRLFVPDARARVQDGR